MLEHVPMRASRRARDKNGRGGSHANDYIIKRQFRGGTLIFRPRPFTRRGDRPRAREDPRVYEGDRLTLRNVDARSRGGLHEKKSHGPGLKFRAFASARRTIRNVRNL